MNNETKILDKFEVLSEFLEKRLLLGEIKKAKTHWLTNLNGSFYALEVCKLALDMKKIGGITYGIRWN